MSWQTTIELLGAFGIWAFASLRWSALIRSLRELRLTLNGKSRNRSIACQPRMTEPLAKFVFKYYGHLTTDQEWLAYRHLAGTMKSTRGRSDVEAQESARHDPAYSMFFSNDPEVLRLASSGYDVFVQRTGERILRERRDQVVLNFCTACGGLARTPTAKQCRYCRNDWHDKDT